MGRIIFAVALAGWAAITGIAWLQADARIANCTIAGITDRDCAARLSAQRDFILTVGLTVALVIVVVGLIATAIIKARQAKAFELRSSGWQPTSPGRTARLR